MWRACISNYTLFPTGRPLISSIKSLRSSSSTITCLREDGLRYGTVAAATSPPPPPTTTSGEPLDNGRGQEGKSVAHKGRQLPRNHWSSLANQRKLFDQIAAHFQVTSAEDWLRVSKKEIMGAPLAGISSVLINHHRNSLQRALRTIYPELDWRDAAKRWRKPSSHWSSLENQRALMEQVMREELKIETLDDFYRVTVGQVHRTRARHIVKRHHGNSLARVLVTIFPEHAWEPERFAKSAKGCWRDEQVLGRVVAELREHLRIRCWEEWYRVSNVQLARYSKRSVIARNGGLAAVLQRIYPEHEWNVDKFQSSAKKSQQRLLRVFVEKLMPTGTVILEDGRLPGLLFSKSNEPMELDVLVEQFNLAFEYNGEHHYKNIDFFGHLNTYEERDREKLEACHQAGITLITVPYTWGGKIETIAATIRAIRPDIPLRLDENSVQLNAKPIEQPSISSHTLLNKNHPSISLEPLKVDTLSSRLMHSTEWNQKISPNGWWMSEKYNGVRCVWFEGELYSRQGKLLANVPDWFKSGLPSITLDGELWLGRDEEPTGIISNKSSLFWTQVKYCVFDMIDTSNKTFEQRQRVLKGLAWPQQVLLVEHEKCQDVQHFAQFREKMFHVGAEGLVIRAPNSYYVHGRSSALRKYKFVQDTEVRMIERHPKCKLLKCEQLNGKIVYVGCSGQTFLHPPRVGSVLLVEHSGMSRTGKLKYPTFIRERTDLSWEDAVHGYQKEGIVTK